MRNFIIALVLIGIVFAGGYWFTMENPETVNNTIDAVKNLVTVKKEK